MAQIVTKTNGQTLVTIQDGVVDTTASSLSLPGNGTLISGLLTNTNFVRMTENFANSVAPANPMRGQLWFDTNRNVFKVWDGTAWGALKSKFLNAITMSLTGDVTGSISFNGTANASIALTLSDTGVLAGASFPRAALTDGGRVRDGTPLTPGDVSSALGYTPVDRNQVVVPGLIPLHGIMLWGGAKDGSDLPAGFTICDGKTIGCGGDILTTPDLRNLFPGGNPGSPNRVPYVMRVCVGAFDVLTPATAQEWPLSVSTTVTNYNVLTAFTALYGAPVGPVRVRVTATSSAIIGSLSPASPALNVGQFPSGSTIILDNSGSIQGAGGIGGASSAGGNGGDAIWATGSNQSVIVNNYGSGSILAGGGGGGAGGVGGNGYYDNCYTVIASAGTGYCTSTAYFGGSAPTVSCTTPYGSSAYCSGGFYYCGRGSQYYCSNCVKPTQTCDRIGTTGGAGGAGGRGTGFGGLLANGSTGSTGGQGAGVGGQGGPGGTWGQAGSSGSTGANGNNGSGYAGSAGGIAGRYLYKSGANVILNNNGTVAGALA